MLGDQTAVDGATTGLNVAKTAQSNFIETATLTVLPPVPDPASDAHFIAKLNHTVLRSDSLNIVVSNGLLNSASATSADQTPTIITTLANTAITIAAIVGSGGHAPEAIGTEVSACVPDSFTKIFDPSNDFELKDVVANLARRTNNLQIIISPISMVIRSPQATTNPVSGLFYRAMTTITITLAPVMQSSRCQLQSPPAAQSLLAVVPDTNTSYVIAAHAGAFTTSAFTFGFTNGTLTAYANQQPSEVAAIAGIPLTIAQSIMSIPTQILQLRVNYVNAATSLANAKSQLTAAQTNALTAAVTAQTQLSQAEAALTQAQASAPTAGLAGQANVAKAQANLAQALTAALQVQKTLIAQ